MPAPRVLLPERRYGAYIFDLDGTLVDSMGTHYRAWREALAAQGAPPEVFRVNEFLSHGGRAARDIVASLNEKYGLQMNADEVAVYKRDRYVHLLETEQLPRVEECTNLVMQLKEAGIPFAIGTGSAMAGALATLRSAGLEGVFNTIITPDEVAAGRGKPCGDIFLLCAQKLGVAPSDCLVLEDASPGIAAAQAAGMDYVRVADADTSTWDAPH